MTVSLPRLHTAVFTTASLPPQGLTVPRPTPDYTSSYYSNLKIKNTNPPTQVSFYWILETSRRRLIHLTLLFITGFLAIGSEILQALLPNDRDFDPFDILANVVGSGLALALCSWYHRRMLERRRRNKHYDAVPADEEPDLELGEGVGLGQQETGRVEGEGEAQAGEGAKRTVTEEVDNWDENAEDEWEEAGEEQNKGPEGSGKK